MSRYRHVETIPLSEAARGSIDIVTMRRNRIRDHVLRKVLDRDLIPGVPIILKLEEETADNGYFVELAVEVETTPITRQAAIRPVILDYPPPDYRAYIPRPPKPVPFSQRLASWWKEMQKPLPYDGPRG